MRPITTLAAALLAAIALAATAFAQSDSATPTVSDAGAAAITTAAPAAEQPAAALDLPAGCTGLYTQRQHRSYARAVYARHTIRPKARKRLIELTRCQRNRPAAVAAAKRLNRRLRHDRHLRLTMLCKTPSCNRRLLVYMADKRFGHGAGSCLVPIIRQESGFRHRINNGGRIGPPSGVAYGIPQALPPHKMASAGPDWATNPKTQIRWLLSYVGGRYGGPCGALSFKRSHGWY